MTVNEMLAKAEELGNDQTANAIYRVGAEICARLDRVRTAVEEVELMIDQARGG